MRTNRNTYRTRSVLLAIGRRGTPRKLDVPGEESPKVVYRLIDPNQYDGQAVLVVGGGDSALEAAIALSERPGTEVTLSYRSAAFGRVKQKNRDLLDKAQKAGRVRVELESTVKNIEAATVNLQTKGGSGIAAQRRRHRLCRRPFAHAVAAKDRHRVRDQARHGLSALCVVGRAALAGPDRFDWLSGPESGPGRH